MEHFHVCSSPEFFTMLDSYATSFRSNEPARYSHIRLISFKI